ncbi:MAG TPA: VWA domain-containing protein [Vicinamibacterales bacterium]|jgi:VWFA-related protein
MLPYYRYVRWVLLLAIVLAPAAIHADTADPVHLVVSVLDAKGRAIAGLTARDFAVREDGIAQRVTAVDPRHAAPRRLAILLDEFHTAPDHSAAVRDGVERFLSTVLRPDDTTIVVKPLDPLLLLRLSSDRAAAEQAASQFEGRKGNYAPRTPLEEETLGRAPALVEAGRAQVVLSALRALAYDLGAASDHSAILFVSEGFVPRPARVAEGLPSLGIVERFANRNDVPVFAIDPAAQPAEASDDAQQEALLQKLAVQTGGSVAHGDDVFGALSRAAADLDDGYTVTFTPSHADDGKYHSVQVSVTRKRLPTPTVLARNGYLAPPSAAMRSAMLAAADKPLVPMRALHRSPWIDVWSGVTGVAAGRARVAITWAPDAEVTVEGTRVRSTASRVTLKASTPDGKVLFQGPLSPVRAGDIGTVGIPTRADFDAPSGTIQLEMAVLGEHGEKLDVDSRDIDVPSLTGASPVVMPPMIVGTWSAKQFEAVAHDPDAPPDPVREFSRMERLLIRVPAYAAGEPVPVAAQLLNRIGKPMRTVTPMSPTSSGITQFDLPLAPFAPGDYYLQFTATHGGKSVDQRMGFRVTG